MSGELDGWRGVMRMPVLVGLVAILVGALNTVQAGANSTLNKVLEAPILTAITVALVNIAVYLAASVAVGFKLPAGDRFGAVPWWAWFGGVMGGLYVLAMIFLAQRLGSALFTGLTVTAAILTSVLLDHFGLVGFDQHPAGLWRILGCALMIGGVALVTAF